MKWKCCFEYWNDILELVRLVAFEIKINFMLVFRIRTYVCTFLQLLHLFVTFQQLINIKRYSTALNKHCHLPFIVKIYLKKELSN